jgi:hypothetical protein
LCARFPGIGYATAKFIVSLYFTLVYSGQIKGATND